MSIITFEKWKKGEDYSVDPDEFFKVLNQSEQEQQEAEKKKIHNAQKEVYEWALKHNLEVWKKYFKSRISQVKNENKEEFIKAERERIYENVLTRDTHQYQEFLQENKDYERVSGRTYCEYLNRDKNYIKKNRSFPLRGLLDKHVAHLFLKWLKDEYNREITLRDFFKDNDDKYHELIKKHLTTSILDKERDLNPIIEIKGNSYYFINKKPNQQYLTAFLLTLIKKGYIELCEKQIKNRHDLNEIIKKTFNCDSFNHNNSNTVLQNRTNDLEEKYFNPYKNIPTYHQANVKIKIKPDPEEPGTVTSV